MAQSETTTSVADVWITPGTSLIVFDFDQTVLNCHAFGEGVEPDEVPGRWKDDVADLDTFRAFVAAAQQRGATLAIASFGRSEVIRAYMDLIAPGAFSDADIVTPASLGSDYEDGMSVENGKPMMLQLLCKRNPVTNLKGAAGVLFFDDDPANVDECRRAGFLRSHHTPQGFTRAALEGLSGATTKRQCAVG